MQETTGIIDVHTHYYPPLVTADPVKWATTQDEKHWRQLVAPEGKPSLQGWASEAVMLRQMAEAGIAKAVLQGWYWEHSVSCAFQNRWYADLIERHPDRFIAFATIHPPSEKETEEQLKFAVDHGFKGIGEIHPAVQGFSLRDRCWMRVAEFAVEHGFPITLHVTEPIGRPQQPQMETSLRDIQWLVEKYPDLRLILAHWGGLSFLHELNPYIAKRWQNVYYDTSASPLLYGSQVFRIAMEAVGPEKFLFGSDYPLRLYPKQQKEPNFSAFISEIRKSIEDAGHLERLFRSNVEKLLE